MLAKLSQVIASVQFNPNIEEKIQLLKPDAEKFL